MRLTEVSDSLWQQRRLLERLVYKFDTVALLVATGRWRWLVMLADETKGVADELDQQIHSWYERLVVESLGGPLNGATPDPALAAPSPRREILAEHDAALARLRAEVRASAQAAIDALTRNRPEVPQVAKDDDQQLATEIFRLAIDGLLAVAHAFVGAPSA